MDYTAEQIAQYTKELKQLVEMHSKPLLILNANGKKRDRIPPRYKHLKDFVIWKTLLLQDEEYELKTKIYWIIHGIKDWNDPHVRCANRDCNKPLYHKNVMTVHSGYHPFCSRKCAMNDIEVRKKIESTNIKRYGAKMFVSSKEGKECAARSKLENHGSSTYNNSKKAKLTKIAKNDGKYASTKQLKQTKKTKTLRYGDASFNNRTKAIATRHSRCNGKYELESSKLKREATSLQRYGYRCSLQNDEVKAKSTRSINAQYGEGHTIQHISQSRHFKQKFEETSMKHFGVKHPMQAQQVQIEARRRYSYDGKYFDSSPELAFYIWLQDNDIEFEFHDGSFLEYEFNGNVMRYFPDFIVEGQMIEIKGNHFFEDNDPSKKMICPFKKKGQSYEDYQLACQKYEAKHQCMIASNVKILTNADYQKYLDYVDQMHGKHYLEQFRTSKK